MSFCCSFEWKHEHSPVCCVWAHLLPLNKAVKETVLVHVLPQCCCKVSQRHHLQDQLQELWGETVSTCQRSSARPPFPLPWPGPQWLNVLLWALSMTSTRPMIWEINAASVSCSQKAGKHKSGSVYTIQGCVQFNVLLYIECFIKHLYDLCEELFQSSCWHAFASCWQSLYYLLSLFFSIFTLDIMEFILIPFFYLAFVFFYFIKIKLKTEKTV